MLEITSIRFNNMKKLSIIKHLEELRKRIIYCLIFFSAAAIFCMLFIDKITALLILTDAQIVFIRPQEAFVVSIRLALLSGLALSLPFLLYQLWAFIRTALTEHERKKLRLFVPLSFLLFAAGIAMAYLVIAPLGLNFLINYGRRSFEPMISLQEYMSFITMLIFVFGLIFQLPLYILFFNSIGVLSRKQLKEKRIYFYVLAFIIGAVLTPPDIITQISLALPIIFLYEVSYLISRK